MKHYGGNMVDFRCHSNGNSETNAVLLQKNTLGESCKLLYIYEGTCRVNIDGRCHEANKGDSVLIFPYCDFVIEKDAGAKYVWLEFSGFACTAILGRIAFSKQKPVLGKIDMDGFEYLFEMPVNTGEAYSLYRLGGCILLLLSYYIEKFPSKTVQNEGYVFRACRFIDAHYSMPGFCVKDVVEALKIDRSHLYRIFKDKTGISVSDYIIRCRINKAEVMLANSDLSIKDVAYSVGFSDQMYFSRVFKRLNGRTPTAFREMIFSEKDTSSKP